MLKDDGKKLREKLLHVNGLGPETVDSILLYAAQYPIFVVDAYTKRIMARIGFRGQKYDELQSLFMSNLPNSEKLFNEYHALIVEHAKRYYAKKGLYQECPLMKKYRI